MRYLKHVLILVAAVQTLTVNAQEQKLKENEKPNILWIELEDTAPLMGCYGTEIIFR